MAKPFYKTIGTAARKSVSKELKKRSSKIRLRSAEKKRRLAEICYWACFGVEKDYLLLAEILLDQKLINLRELDTLAKKTA